jgi:hypothetical protein
MLMTREANAAIAGAFAYHRTTRSSTKTCSISTEFIRATVVPSQVLAQYRETAFVASPRSGLTNSAPVTLRRLDDCKKPTWLMPSVLDAIGASQTSEFHLTRFHTEGADQKGPRPTDAALHGADLAADQIRSGLVGHSLRCHEDQRLALGSR